MTDKSLEYYIDRYIRGTLTEDEGVILRRLLDRPEHQKALEALMDGQLMQWEKSELDFREVTERVQNAIDEQIVQHPPAAPPRRIYLLRKWWVAASALLLAGIGTYFWALHRKHAPLTAIVTKTPDIAPGSSKAILTLSDGSQMALDSASNQVIQQGNVQVQQRNGQLLYLHAAAATPSSDITYNLLAVPRGGQFKVVLPDGSQVWLNSASSLRYPTAFAGGERRVEMQGQAYFEIKPNAAQPFIVKANNAEIQVLGTSFDVMAYPDEPDTRTTLVQGAVNVKQGAEQRRLEPGLAAAVNNTTGRFSVQKADLRAATAWKAGFFDFENASLTTILKQLSRWYNVEADYSQVPAATRFGGYISRNLPLQEVLAMLETRELKFKLEGRAIKIVKTK